MDEWMFSLLRSLSSFLAGKLCKGFYRTKWSRTSFSYSGILKTEGSSHICIFKGVKFLTFVTCALPLVAVSEMQCDYRNSPPPLKNVSAEADFRDFFNRWGNWSPSRGDFLWSFTCLVTELSWACDMSLDSWFHVLSTKPCYLLSL